MEQTADNVPDYGRAVNIQTKRSIIKPRTPNQAQYIAHILGHDITLGIGQAGTGKTYLAATVAVDALERQEIRRILLTRPAVEAGEKLGFLPGDLSQKVDPYLRPLYDALFEMLGFERVEKLIERNVIEAAPLAYMRGRTLNDAFIILDESQNTTVEISFNFFQSEDVVRQPVVARIVNAYEAWGSANKKRKDQLAAERTLESFSQSNGAIQGGSGAPSAGEHTHE
ncbi:MAG: PhoH-like protein [Sodalis sp.]|nr:MAG: PhoH-like protein [Sodalis sp.]